MDVVFVAHRAAEVAEQLTLATEAADRVEVDVHLFRGRLEVRHAKVLWPLACRWDRWHRVPRGAPRPTLEDVIHLIDPNTHLWVDLKGFSSRLTRRVLLTTFDRPLTTVSSRSWWILPRPGDCRNVQVVHSVGSRLQLWAVLRRAPGSLEAVAVDRRLVGADSMAALRRITSLVFVWGIRDVEHGVSAIEAGADGLIVDGIDTIARLRERFVSSAEVPKEEVRRTITATPPLA